MLLPALLKTGVAKLALVAAAGLGGYEGWKYLYPRLQSLRSTNKNGDPIQVVVPVGKKVVNIKGIKSQTVTPPPPNNGTSAVFLPPPPAAPSRIGLEPAVITPSGASPLSVDNVSDIQQALNALGQSPAIATDGVLGPATKSAISSFQGAHGMVPDGQPSQPLRSAIQAALGRVAGTNAHVGQSTAVQGAAAPGLTMAMNLAASPAGSALISTGLGAIANAFSDTPDSDMSADTAASGPTKDAVVKWQRILNLLGASPALAEDGTMSPETIAATKAFQITYGLVADGVPGPKTATAAAVTVTGLAHPDNPSAVVPSIPAAADHVSNVAATAPDTTKKDLSEAASKLATAASNPVPTDSQTHASTAAAQAATASTAAPTAAIAVPLATATNALAGATTTPTLDPTNLAVASAALSTAAAAATGTSSAPSLAAAADHVAAAANAPDTATAGDHLNSAAQHLANAAVGTPTAADVAANVNGEFGWDIFGLKSWWQNRGSSFFNWHQTLHPAYAPPVPAHYAPYQQQSPMNYGYGHPYFRGEFGFVAPPPAPPSRAGGYVSPPTGYGMVSPPAPGMVAPPPAPGMVAPPPAPGYRHHHHAWGPQGYNGQGYGGQQQYAPQYQQQYSNQQQYGYGQGYGQGDFGMVMPPPPPGRMVYPGAPPQQAMGNDYWRNRRMMQRNMWDQSQGMYPMGAPPQPWAPGPPGAPPVQFDPNAINQYQDPNAGNPAVQDPGIDSAMPPSDYQG